MQMVGRQGHASKSEFKIIRLTSDIVSRNKRRLDSDSKKGGERLFAGLMALLNRNFPPNEIENAAQFRRYFYDKYSANWFVEAAVEPRGNVVGASLFSYCPAVDLVMYNIVAVDSDFRRMGIAAGLVNSMIEQGMSASISAKSRGLEYVMGEIERPDASLPLHPEDLKLRNRIRPQFHDQISKLRAIQTESGEPLEYLLPIMATDEERAQAAKDGKPLIPEPLLFCLRPLESPESAGISARKTAKLLAWFYKDYLEAECSDVKKDEVNDLLSIAISTIADGLNRGQIRDLIETGKRGLGKMAELIPENLILQFTTIAGTAK